MTQREISTDPGRAQAGSVTRAIAAMRSDDSVVKSARVIPPPAIGSGYVVIRRNAASGVLQKTGRRPFEHPTLEVAVEEAERLAEIHGDAFAVFAQVETVSAPERPVDTVAPAAMIAIPDPASVTPTVTPPSKRPPVVFERRAKRRPATRGRAA
ncbi:hypothetical protein FV219_01375 [Methylobacterium sp. WL122]|nr:hypothetical protein FV219_01375 [Methylobacterium sp. WL122]